MRSRPLQLHPSALSPEEHDAFLPYLAELLPPPPSLARRPSKPTATGTDSNGYPSWLEGDVRVDDVGRFVLERLGLTEDMWEDILPLYHPNHSSLTPRNSASQSHLRHLPPMRASEVLVVLRLAWHVVGAGRAAHLDGIGLVFRQASSPSSKSPPSPEPSSTHPSPYKSMTGAFPPPLPSPTSKPYIPSRDSKPPPPPQHPVSRRASTKSSSSKSHLPPSSSGQSYPSPSPPPLPPAHATDEPQDPRMRSQSITSNQQISGSFSSSSIKSYTSNSSSATTSSSSDENNRQDRTLVKKKEGKKSLEERRKRWATPMEGFDDENGQSPFTSSTTLANVSNATHQRHPHQPMSILVPSSSSNPFRNRLASQDKGQSNTTELNLPSPTRTNINDVNSPLSPPLPPRPSSSSNLISTPKAKKAPPPAPPLPPRESNNQTSAQQPLPPPSQQYTPRTIQPSSSSKPRPPVPPQHLSSNSIHTQVSIAPSAMPSTTISSSSTSPLRSTVAPPPNVRPSKPPKPPTLISHPSQSPFTRPSSIISQSLLAAKSERLRQESGLEKRTSVEVISSSSGRGKKGSASGENGSFVSGFTTTRSERSNSLMTTSSASSATPSDPFAQPHSSNKLSSAFSPPPQSPPPPPPMRRNSSRYSNNALTTSSSLASTPDRPEQYTSSPFFQSSSTSTVPPPLLAEGGSTISRSKTFSSSNHHGSSSRPSILSSLPRTSTSTSSITAARRQSSSAVPYSHSNGLLADALTTVGSGVGWLGSTIASGGASLRGGGSGREERERERLFDCRAGYDGDEGEGSDEERRREMRSALDARERAAPADGGRERVEGWNPL